MDLLTTPDDARVVVVSALAGYRKSTVLLQWSEVDPCPFVWLRWDSSDAEVVLFLRRLAIAVHRRTPVEGAVVMTLARRLESAPDIARLVPNVLGTAQEPFVLVLDDVHHLANTPPQT